MNCVRTFPFLRSLDERYSDEGLTIVGVHSPEYELERLPINSHSAVAPYGLLYPVAVDSDTEICDLFGNHFWPSIYLFDSSGELVYQHFGEGGRYISRIKPMMDEGSVLAAGVHTITREIYTGYERVYELDGLFAAQGRYYDAPEVTILYEDVGLRRHGQFELHGLWRNEKDGIAHLHSTEFAENYIEFPFFATSVNVVMSSEIANSTVAVEVDGEPSWMIWPVPMWPTSMAKASSR